MLGQMQNFPLALPHVFHRAESLFGHKRVVGVGVGGAVTTTTYAEWAVRVRRTVAALDALGVAPDARVGTFCWNNPTHLELYFAVPCSGRILHTLNIRLFTEQLVYVVEHADDEVVFVDRSLLGLFWPHVDRMPHVRRVVVIDDGSDTPVPDDERVLDHAELLASVAPREGRLVVDDEDRAAAMCYTSGTTGNPKGVVYSHRSTVLHSINVLIADVVGLSERDVLLPIVPMFHANAWGTPYAAVLAGSTVVLPGPERSSDTPPQEVTVRVQAVGTSPTTLRAKAWTSGSEPDAWAVTASDDTSGLQRPGAVGLEVAHRGDGPAELLVSDLVGRVAP